MAKGRRRGAESDTVIDLVGVNHDIERVIETTPLPQGAHDRANRRRTRFPKTPLAYLLARMPGGRRRIFSLLALSDDEDAKRLTEAFRDLNQFERYETPIEDLIAKLEMTAEDFIRLVQQVGTTINYAVGEALHAFAYPKIMEASIAEALTPDGTADRRIHLERSGFAASKKGAFIQVNQNNQTNVEREPEPGEPTPFDRTARRVVRDIPARPALPPGQR